MCGVFGVVLPPGTESGAAAVAALGLFALQHRGQESAGVAVSDGEQLMLYKDLGMISSVLDERRLPSLRGDLAIAHCRYSTTGSTVWENAQPTFRLGPRRAVAIGHNGNLVNTRQLLGELRGGRARLPASTDTELLTALLADEPGTDTVDALLRVLPRLRGAYSLVVLDERRVIGLRDPFGFRPLVLGRLPLDGDRAGTGPGLWADDATSGWVLSSETTGLDIVGAEYVRDVEPGELVMIDERGLHSRRFAPPTPTYCLFEWVYLARPDHRQNGRSVLYARREMGRILAREAPVDAGIVIAVPDSGRDAAAGYATEAGLPFADGLVKNRYVGRTFIQPTQSLRQMGIRLKLSPVREVVEGRRLVVVDDSIVRGNTSRQLVAMLRSAGAAEVHLRITSPPIKNPCYYGIDMATRAELIGADLTEQEICDYVGADSLHYITLDGLIAATPDDKSGLCRACFDGEYPIEVPGEHVELAQTKFEFEDV